MSHSTHQPFGVGDSLSKREPGMRKGFSSILRCWQYSAVSRSRLAVHRLSTIIEYTGGMQELISSIYYSLVTFFTLNSYRSVTVAKRFLLVSKHFSRYFTSTAVCPYFWVELLLLLLSMRDRTCVEETEKSANQNEFCSLFVHIFATSPAFNSWW